MVSVRSLRLRTSRMQDMASYSARRYASASRSPLSLPSAATSRGQALAGGIVAAPEALQYTPTLGSDSAQRRGPQASAAAPRAPTCMRLAVSGSLASLSLAAALTQDLARQRGVGAVHECVQL